MALSDSNVSYTVFQKKLYNGISNLTVLRILRKRLYLKAYELYIVLDLGLRTVCTPLSVNVFITLEYHFRVLFETPCIASEP
jgi:hypothetical protein